MSLSDLSPEEDTLLLGLMRSIVQADGDYSPQEKREIAALREEMGGARFDTAVAAAEARFADETPLKALAKTVTAVPTQTVILRRLMRVAAADGVTPGEEKPLRWLANAWPSAQVK